MELKLGRREQYVRRFDNGEIHKAECVCKRCAEIIEMKTSMILQNGADGKQRRVRQKDEVQTLREANMLI
jgi:hypothetical protein